MDSFTLMDVLERDMFMRPKHEQSVIWAAREWMLRSPEEPFTVVITREEACDERALTRVKVGRKLKQKATYMGHQQITCPYIVPLTGFSVPGRHVVFDRAGAFLFHFNTSAGDFTVDLCLCFHGDPSLHFAGRHRVGATAVGRCVGGL